MPISELSALLNGTTSSAGITGARHHKSSIPAQQIQRTGARKRACRGETGRSVSTKHEHVHSRTQRHRVHTQPSHTIIPASCRNPASRHSRCSAQALVSGLAGAERAKPHSRSTRTPPRNLAASRGKAAERQR